MDAEKSNLVCGWRGLSLVVSATLGRPVGVGKVRWIVESRALSVGQRLGASLVFDAADVAAVADLIRKSGGNMRHETRLEKLGDGGGGRQGPKQG